MPQKISPTQVMRWSDRVDQAFLNISSEEPWTRLKVVTGYHAWALAHNLNIYREACEDYTVVDAHVQTALETIFPNAIFFDRKVY